MDLQTMKIVQMFWIAPLGPQPTPLSGKLETKIIQSQNRKDFDVPPGFLR